ncbi:MAG: hypothetical protein PWQ09_1572 [Candidatus Cloacimonadota bacterium]|jgi:hypothetical protein|nr:hypothetical protein [Candidatus Cloacimonadota bacterium]
MFASKNSNYSVEVVVLVDELKKRFFLGKEV